MKSTEAPSQGRPTARCKAFAPLLPVLDVPGVESSEVAEARAHLAHCAYCQAHQAAYRQVDTALRRYLSPPLTPRYRTEQILRDLEVMTSLVQEQSPPAARERVAPVPMPGSARPRRPGRGRPVLSGLASLVAVLVIVLFAVTLFAHHPGPRGPTGTRPAGANTIYESTLGDIAMVSPTEGWAVGGTSTQNALDPGSVKVVLMHYLHGAWSAVDVPLDGYLTSISMDSATDGWAVGQVTLTGQTQPTPLLFHYDGQTWKRARISAQYGMPQQVQMLSATDGWMVGQDFTQQGAPLSALWHYDGQTWTAQPLPAELSARFPSQSLAVLHLSMISSTEGWAIGGAASRTTTTSFILHYTEGSWQVQRLFTDVTVQSLSMLSTTDGWITAMKTASTVSGANPSMPMLLHYTGGQWVDATARIKDASKLGMLLGVFMRSPTDGWMVVQKLGYHGIPTLLHFTGTQWTEASLPTLPNTSTLSIRGITMLSGTDGWAVGDHELKNAPGYVTRVTPVILHYANGRWSVAED
jgi:hypothetical protein